MIYHFRRIERKKGVYILIGVVLISVIFASILLFVSKEKYKFPEKDDFLLTSSVSSKLLKVGDSIDVKGVFRNLTYRSFRLYSDASFSKSGLMHIYIYKVDEDEMIFVGCERFVDISPKQEVHDELTQKMKEKGKYKVVISSNIEIKATDSKDIKKYNLKAEKIYIEVK